MTKSVFRWMLIFALLAGGFSGPARSYGQEVATVDQLKTDAFRALSCLPTAEEVTRVS